VKRKSVLLCGENIGNARSSFTEGEKNDEGEKKRVPLKRSTG
jgi:hypothetical protein